MPQPDWFRGSSEAVPGGAVTQTAVLGDPMVFLLTATVLPGFAFTMSVSSDGTVDRLEVHGPVLDQQGWLDAVRDGRRPPSDPVPPGGLTSRRLRQLPI